MEKIITGKSLGAARYRINEHWLPYFELRWLDRNVEPYHREQNQIRIGTKYFF